VCVQINLSNEKNKSGAELDYARKLCSVIASLPNLRLRGLMAIPAPLPDLESQRNCFHQLKLAFEALKKSYTSMDTLSMGMTNDFEAAVAEGSTMVRLGSAIFGPRA
jgi:pyridoxal phosphate enzyme (YggS family)